jgi:hypothetical protein
MKRRCSPASPSSYQVIEDSLHLDFLSRPALRCDSPSLGADPTGLATDPNGVFASNRGGAPSRRCSFFLSRGRKSCLPPEPARFTLRKRSLRFLSSPRHSLNHLQIPLPSTLCAECSFPLSVSVECQFFSISPLSRFLRLASFSLSHLISCMTPRPTVHHSPPSLR